jgi:O-antigen/teichoic acid export membrane protein
MTTSNNVKHSSFSNEVALAVRNGIKLMASLVVTLGVAFAVRFWVPRFLGPEVFGIVHFAEQFSLFMAFVVSFGADVYIRKEVSSRPEHASEFFGGLLLFRGLVAIVIGIAVALILWAMGKEAYVWYVVFTFLVAQILYILNVSFGALLEAKGTVSELAATNAALKVVWGTGIVSGLLLGLGPIVIPGVFCITEAIKSPILYRVARKHLDLKLTFDYPAAKSIVIASLPYWINSVAIAIYSRIGVSILSGMENDQEVGWYGAAQNIAVIVFLFLPVLRSIVMPMGSRLAKESPEMAAKTMAAAARLMMMFSIPLAVLLGLNASDVIRILYTENYLPSASVIRIGIFIIPLTYLCTLSSVYLIQIGQIWSVVKVTCVAMVLSPASRILFLKLAADRFGDGSGGIVLAAADILTESTVAVLLYLRLKSHLTSEIKRRFGKTILRIALASGLIGVLHQFIGFLGYGRIAVDVIVYAGLAFLLGVLPINELKIAAKTIIERKRRKRK